MRIFVLIGEENEIINRKGIVSRFVVASLLISRSIRRNAISCIFLNNIKKAIFLYGSNIRQLRADESSAWGIIRKAIKSSHKRPHSGVLVEKVNDIEDILKKFKVSKIFVRSNIGVDVEKAILGTGSFIYLTSLSSSIHYREAIPIFFRSNLRPEQEVVIINILCDRAGIS
ncbi:MAG: hypothetical protein GXO26_04905 [Crenarchaeota archaeon]|nr:hypothetical protein [Thermoproteota archaeon]